MPTYDYQCNKCGYRFEKVQSFSDSPLKACPRCKGHVHRIVHATGIVFKGAGFYITDSRKNGDRSGNGKSAESKSTEPVAKTEKAAEK